MLRRLFGAFLALIVVSAVRGQGLPSTEWKEVIAATEAQEFAQAAVMINQLQQYLAGKGDGTLRRGFHAKTHASLAGEFKVMDGIPEFARFGIFKESKTYVAYGRFSNGVGSVERDGKGDVRGFAFKVTGATGPMLEAEEDGQLTQDFLMTNNPVSPARSGTQFLAFARAAMAGPIKALPVLIRDLGFIEATRMVTFLATHVNRTIRSMALENYWSGGAIKLGPYAVKFMLRPAGAAASSLPAGPVNYLRDELKARLAKADVKFDFLVQFWNDPKKTPIEDASIEWKEQDAPFIKLAELTFHSRDLDSADAKAEQARVDAMTFNPWHAPEDLRPVGNIMRVRRAVYASSARFRRQQQTPARSE